MQKRLTVLLLAAWMLLCFAACGREDALCGSYRCTGAQTPELTLDGSLFRLDAVLTLRPDGRGTIARNGQTGSLSWSRSGETLELTVGGRVLPCSVSEEKLLLSPEPGVTLCFEREEALPAAEDPALPRDWYGWWSIENSQGTLPETWYDCCAHLEHTAHGWELSLWDEDTDRKEPLAAALLQQEESGLFRSEDGWFLLAPLGEGEWRLDLTENPLILDGHLEGGGERFDYRVCLRPWGDLWEQREERIPYHLYDWYLPRIASGAGMPDQIG